MRQEFFKLHRFRGECPLHAGPRAAKGLFADDINHFATDERSDAKPVGAMAVRKLVVPLGIEIANQAGHLIDDQLEERR